jgi:hypothetical protein
MWRLPIGAILALTGVAVALVLATSPPATGASRDSGCVAYGDLPLPAPPLGAVARLTVAGEFHCTGARSLAVEVCAARLAAGGYTPVLKPIWCVHRIVKVAAGSKAFVRTPSHVCTVGRDYMSYVHILGTPFQTGPFHRCRTFG